MGKMNYHSIKRAAAETQGVTIKDLIVLAQQNDPFYVGTNGDVAKAQWFAAIWSAFGYTRGVHLRRVHYRLVSQSPPISKPNGKPYGNTEADWDYLCMAGKTARYLDAVSPSAFVDRRNPSPHIFARYWEDDDGGDGTTPGYELNGDSMQIELPEFPDAPDFEVSGYERRRGDDGYMTGGNLQPVHIECWIEKSTMNDVMLPLCRRYDINLVTGVGEMSITSALEMVQRIQEAGRPARILYISDFDPAGYGMPVGVSRKMEYFLANYGLDLDIQLEPIALTSEQVAAYNLPRTPIKRSELRRRSFEQTHGRGAVELDALEALHEGELAKVVTQAILRYHDPDIRQAAQDQREELEEALSEARAEALEPYADEMVRLHRTFQEALATFEQAVQPVQERLAELHPQITDALTEIDIDPDEYPVPDPQEADELESPLYNSQRDYFQQLAQYKHYQNGGNQ